MPWHNMIFPVIRGHKLEGYILGTKACPAEFTVNDAGECEPNPDFEDFVATDHLLKGWLYGMMTTELAMQLMNCESSHQLWVATKNLAGAHTRSRVIFFKNEFQNSRKGTQKMLEYLNKMKTLSDNLLLAGSPVSNDDLVTQTLAGLDSEYTPVVWLLAEKKDLSWIDLQSTLLTFESRIEQIRSRTTSGITTDFANLTFGTENRGWRGSGQHYNRGSGSRGKNRGGRNNRPTCQVCNKTRHIAAHCYFRFDKNYMGPETRRNGGSSSFDPTSAYIATSETLTDPAWYADSGASSHVTADATKIEPHKQVAETGKRMLIVGNGKRVPVTAIGSSNLPCRDTSNTLVMNDVLVVPSITKNLLSVSKLTNDNDVFVEFHGHGCYVKDKVTKEILLEGKPVGGLYRIDDLRNGASFIVDQNVAYAFTLESWHRKLGHPSNSVLTQILKDCNVNLKSNEKFTFCDACQYGKSHCLPFTKSESLAAKPLDLIHTDLWGPTPITSNDGYKYYISFLDDHSRFLWLFPLKSKDQASHAFLQFQKLVENQFDRRIKILQSDWGGEFRSFVPHLASSGIAFRHPCPHTSAQNGRVERKHRHIVEMGLSLLAQASMPLKFWWDAFATAAHLINRLPTPVLKHEPPFSKLFHKRPNYHDLKTFGCTCFPCLRPYNRHKLQFNSTKCVFLGYNNAHKGY